MASPFFIQPASFGQGLQSLAGSVQQFGQQQKQEQAAQQEAERQQAAQQALTEAVQSGDPAAMRNVITQFPEVAERATQAFGFTNDQSEAAAREAYRRALSDPENAAQHIQQGIQQVSSVGGRPSMMTRDFQMLQENPEAALKSIRSGYAALASDQEYDAMFGGQGGSGPQFGTVNPRDWTGESMAKFEKTGNWGDLVRYESKRNVDIGGVPHVFDPSIGGYVPASRSGAPGGQPGAEPDVITAEDVAGSEATIAGATARAKQDVKADSPEERRRSREAVESVRSELSNAQDTLQQIENLTGNREYIDALTGLSGKTPAVPGSTKYDAKVAFDQFRDTLTLENLGKMSGVLSETDIKILSSAAGGIEPGMSEEAFTDRMDTIRSVLKGKSERAQRKLQEMTREPGGEGGMSDADADAFINSVLGQ